MPCRGRAGTVLLGDDATIAAHGQRPRMGGCGAAGSGARPSAQLRPARRPVLPAKSAVEARSHCVAAAWHDRAVRRRTVGATSVREDSPPQPPAQKATRTHACAHGIGIARGSEGGPRAYIACPELGVVMHVQKQPREHVRMQPLRRNRLTGPQWLAQAGRGVRGLTGREDGLLAAAYCRREPNGCR